MLTEVENDRLTQVVGDAPMARLMREQCWVPFARQCSMTFGEAPQRVRLFGEDFVAFRAEDGRVGFVDERCPHRGVSLALARVEGCALRCIYHGWKVDASGTVLEVPTEGSRSAEVAAKVKVNHYPTREAGGLIWVYLGRKAPPEFPHLPFMDVPPENQFITRTIVPCNWLQSLEGALDSSHVGWLHQSWFTKGGDVDATMVSVPPAFKTKDTRYGMRAAATRDLPDGTSFLRVAEFVMPFTVLLATDRKAAAGREFSSTMTVPIDSESHIFFWYIWNDRAPIGDMGYGSAGRDMENYAPLRGTRDNNWGQDRAAMDAGHFSGFTEVLIQEDIAAQVAMGTIADRTREQLCSTDLAIAQARRSLLGYLKKFEAGDPVDAIRAYEQEGKLPFAGAVPKGFDWLNETIGAAA